MYAGGTRDSVWIRGCGRRISGMQVYERANWLKRIVLASEDVDGVDGEGIDGKGTDWRRSDVVGFEDQLGHLW